MPYVPQYHALANITLGSAQATVNFGSIPSGYRDLRLVISGSLSADTGLGLRFNSDTGSSYIEVALNARANNSVDTGAGTGTSLFGDFYNSGVLFIKTIDMFDYSQTDKHKTGLCRTGAAGVSGTSTTGVQMITGRWASTSVISSIQLITGAGNFAAGSTFALYGVK